ncbi:hypothetical protein CCUS01_04969 [Colletotrichum cuscutae]|uniref:Uncharacterized protein n=1 Tax=Colletotrichum cuscutae TaxID=1209917 RepID=A0AAI9VAR0_9PEZI|nr:hypothetical protein CCUS01_04969 [Colletotrichum cuscutae]
MVEQDKPENDDSGATRTWESEKKVMGGRKRVGRKPELRNLRDEQYLVLGIGIPPPSLQLLRLNRCQQAGAKQRRMRIEGRRDGVYTTIGRAADSLKSTLCRFEEVAHKQPAEYGMMRGVNVGCGVYSDADKAVPMGRIPIARDANLLRTTTPLPPYLCNAGYLDADQPIRYGAHHLDRKAKGNKA